jgi:hypothetical protein
VALHAQTSSGPKAYVSRAAGGRAARVRVLMEDEVCAAGVAALITDIRNGRHTSPNVRRRLLASALIPVAKPNGSLRPIAMGEVLYKTAAVAAAPLMLARHEVRSGKSACMPWKSRSSAARMPHCKALADVRRPCSS